MRAPPTSVITKAAVGRRYSADAEIGESGIAEYVGEKLSSVIAYARLRAANSYGLLRT